MAQEVGIDALGDAGAVGDLAEDLTDALSGEGRRDVHLRAADG